MPGTEPKTGTTSKMPSTIGKVKYTAAYSPMTTTKTIGTGSTKTEMSMRASMKGQSILGRLEPPKDFKDRRYYTLCLKPQYMLIVMFVLSLIFGVGMIVVASVAVYFKIWIFVWLIVGGVLKLAGAGMCLALLMKTTRSYVIAYLTETILEMVMAVLGFVLPPLWMNVYGDVLKWRTRDKEAMWFASNNFKEQLVKMNRDVGNTYGVMAGCLVIVVVMVIVLVFQVITIFRFTKYVEDRNDYLIRTGAGVAITESAMVPGETVRGGALTQYTATEKTQTGLTRGTSVARTVQPPNARRPESSAATMTRDRRNESFVGSSKKGQTLPRNHGGRPASGPYATVNPPSPTQVKREREERRWNKRIGR